MQMRDKIILLFNTSESYIDATYVAIHSIVRKGLGNTFKIYIFCACDVTEASEQKLRLMQSIFVDLEICIIHIFNEDISSGNTLFDRIPNVAYSRLFAPKYILEDKCLYLDQDIFVSGDIYELFSLSIKKYLIAGVHDMSAEKHISDLSEKDNSFVDEMNAYINAGVVLMNLKMMRETNWLEKIPKLISLNLPMGDEDCLNIAAKGHVLLLPEKFNIQQKSFLLNDSCCLIHYSGNRKPWNNVYVPYAKSWWNDCQQTIVFDEFLQKARLAIYNGFMNEKPYSVKDVLSLCKESNVWIFGAGKLGKQVLRLLENNDIPVKGFIVSDMEKQTNLDIDGISVSSYLNVPDKENASVLVASARDWALICDSLYHSCFKNVYDVTYLLNEN